MIDNKENVNFVGFGSHESTPQLVHYGMNYSGLRHELKKSGILLNRKVLSQVALRDEQAFDQLVSLIKESN